MQVGVSGIVEIRLVDSEGNVRFAHRQNNLVLNRGLEYIASSLSAELAHMYVAVGTGAGTPDPTATGLSGEVARTNQTLGLGADLSIVSPSDGVYEITRVRTFDYGQANGALTEFGCSPSSNPADGTLTWSKFVDSSNNPIVINKTASDRLIIAYTLRFTFSPVALTATSPLPFYIESALVSSLGTYGMFRAPQPYYWWERMALDISLVASIYRTTSGFQVASPTDMTVSCDLFASPYYPTSYSEYGYGDYYAEGTIGGWGWDGGATYRDFLCSLYVSSPAQIYAITYSRDYQYYGGGGYMVAFKSNPTTPQSFPLYAGTTTDFPFRLKIVRL